MTPTRKLSHELDENTLLLLIMTLSGGSVNPPLIIHFIKRIKAEVKNEIKAV